MASGRRQSGQGEGRAILYLRVSTEEQVLHGVSLDAQEAALRAYCAMRALEVAEVALDAGVSGGICLAERPAGKRLTESLNRGEARAVVAWKLDRLFRDCADCLNTVAGWDRRGVALHLVDLGGATLDSSSAMGRFFLTVMAGAAELERNMVRDRTKLALARKKVKGERVGQIPYGYSLHADQVHLVPKPEEVAILDRMRALRGEGVSFEGIASQLNAEGCPARGSRWHKATLVRLLR